MYTFTDPGGNKVSLRPEFTASAIRYYLERSEEETLPLRLQYDGPVFRYGEANGYNQFHQLGAELIGSTAPEADGEILAMAWDGISLLGVPSPQCVIGHIGTLHLILEGLGLSQRAQVFLVTSLLSLRQAPEEGQRVLEQAKALGLLASQDSASGAHPLLEDLEEGEAVNLLQDLLHGSLNGLLGSRSMEDILTRFIRNVHRGDDPQQIERGISLLSRIASITGDGETVLHQLRSAVIEFGLDPTVLSPLEQVIDSFHRRCPSVSLIVDMGLVRGIAYYTGMVFEVMAPGTAGPMTLCGGGRYDGLVKALGGEEDVAALGFAYNVETLLELLPEKLEGRHLASSYPQ
jgi:histidyl-tRNA synthetase